MLDLLVIGRNSHEVSVREAAIWSGIWIFLSLSFAVFLRFYGEIVHGIESFEELKNITQKYYCLETTDKFDALCRIMEVEESFYSIIF